VYHLGAEFGQLQPCQLPLGLVLLYGRIIRVWYYRWTQGWYPFKHDCLTKSHIRTMYIVKYYTMKSWWAIHTSKARAAPVNICSPGFSISRFRTPRDSWMWSWTAFAQLILSKFFKSSTTLQRPLWRYLMLLEHNNNWSTK